MVAQHTCKRVLITDEDEKYVKRFTTFVAISRKSFCLSANLGKFHTEMRKTCRPTNENQQKHRILFFDRTFVSIDFCGSYVTLSVRCDAKTVD